MKQKKRGRERGGGGRGREGVSERLSCHQPAPTCMPVASCHGSSTQPTWWHHLVGLSGWEGREWEGKERGEVGQIILHKLLVNLPSQLEQKRYPVA